LELKKRKWKWEGKKRKKKEKGKGGKNIKVREMPDRYVVLDFSYTFVYHVSRERRWLYSVSLSSPKYWQAGAPTFLLTFQPLLVGFGPSYCLFARGLESISR
jgi:hypothetical protein